MANTTSNDLDKTDRELLNENDGKTYWEIYAQQIKQSEMKTSVPETPTNKRDFCYENWIPILGKEDALWFYQCLHALRFPDVQYPKDPRDPGGQWKAKYEKLLRDLKSTWNHDELWEEACKMLPGERKERERGRVGADTRG